MFLVQNKVTLTHTWLTLCCLKILSRPPCFSVCYLHCTSFGHWEEDLWFVCVCHSVTCLQLSLINVLFNDFTVSGNILLNIFLRHIWRNISLHHHHEGVRAYSSRREAPPPPPLYAPSASLLLSASLAASRCHVDNPVEAIDLHFYIEKRKPGDFSFNHLLLVWITNGATPNNISIFNCDRSYIDLYAKSVFTIIQFNLLKCKMDIQP